MAYPAIVAGGARACVLHYNDNNQRVNDGELVLIDAAAELDYYASDITRTFPANGRFSAEQRILYEIVLKTQYAVIAAIRPGVRWDALQQLSEHEITAGLHAAGFLQGSLESLLADKAWKPFYVHGFGHWVGMDVHDVGVYRQGKAWCPLEAGMVLTVEPGIYISTEVAKLTAKVDCACYPIGIRIEDVVLVTDSGCEVLTAAVPKEVVAIEALMAKK
jgi:Xaa-Pro aminopeptidase